MREAGREMKEEGRTYKKMARINEKKEERRE